MQSFTGEPLIVFPGGRTCVRHVLGTFVGGTMNTGQEIRKVGTGLFLPLQLRADEPPGWMSAFSGG